MNFQNSNSSEPKIHVLKQFCFEVPALEEIYRRFLIFFLIVLTPKCKRHRVKNSNFRFECLREIEAIFENISAFQSGSQIVLFSERKQIGGKTLVTLSLNKPLKSVKLFYSWGQFEAKKIIVMTLIVQYIDSSK